MMQSINRGSVIIICYLDNGCLLNVEDLSMKKLLFQFDTDIHPSSFDTVVAYDGGADHVVRYGGLNPTNVLNLVEGAIFTRGPKDKKNTAIFIGGSNMLAGENIFDLIQSYFFSGFRVSLMLDSNGGNTTAAAVVACFANQLPLAGKKAVVLAGTGPVGQRAAVMLAQEGAEVSITSRSLKNAQLTCEHLQQRFNVQLTAIEAADYVARGAAIAQAQIVLTTGAAGVELLKPEQWQNNPNILLMADANAVSPLGIGGIELTDKAMNRHQKIIWGALGFGYLKLALHRACITQLFTDNQHLLDANAIFALAKQMQIKS